MYRPRHFSRRLLHRIAGMVFLSALIAFSATQARANQDVVHFGSSIDVPVDGSVHDAVCFFCSVRTHGTVRGEIVVFFGSVEIEGHADHDVVDFFGDVTASDDSSIGHSLVNFFGRVRLGENVKVGQDTVVMFGNMRSASTTSFGGDQVYEPGWIFWIPFLLIAGGISFVVHEVRMARRRRYLRGY
jgi:hypothetical protein